MSEGLATDSPLIWANPSAGKDRPTLVRLTPYNLTLAVVPSADLEHVIAELENGWDVAGHSIPLDSLYRVKGQEDSVELTVSFRTGPSQGESKLIKFVDRTQRDEFVTALARALGPHWRHDRKPMSRWVAGFWTLGPTAIVALITWGLHAEAARIAAGQPPVNWGRQGKLKLLALAAHWAEQQLGPSGVLIAGGVLVAVGLLFFAVAMAEPPVSIELEPVDQT